MKRNIGGFNNGNNTVFETGRKIRDYNNVPNLDERLRIIVEELSDGKIHMQYDGTQLKSTKKEFIDLVFNKKAPNTRARAVFIT